MKKLAWTTVIIFLLLAGPVTAQYYSYFDEDAYLCFTDDFKKAPPEQRANIRKYRESGAGLTSSSIESMTPIKNSQEATGEPSADQMFGLVAPAADGMISRKVSRTQIEKIKEQPEAEYLALTKKKDALIKEIDSKESREELVSYNMSVDAFNERAANYEQMSSELSKLVDEYNAFLCFSLR